MFDKQILLLYLLLILINAASVSASESDDGTFEEKKLVADTQSEPSQMTQPLNLIVAPDIINESKKQQNTVRKKSNQLLPNIFKDQQIEQRVSMEGDMLITDEHITSEAIDGAEISIKVKTD